MRRFLLAVAFALIAVGAGAAENHTAFPPDNCSTASPFMSFNGAATGENTYCTDGQFILKNAIPNCAANQEVAYDGSKFYCRNVPTCAGGELLTFDGTIYECKPMGVPSGTLCGLTRWEQDMTQCVVVAPCQGYDPCTSCPQGYSSVVQGQNFGPTCVKN